MANWPTSMSGIEAAGLLRTFCKKGLCLSGGFALQFYLPPEYRKKREDDIDLILRGAEGRGETLRFLNNIGKQTGLGEFKFVEKHTLQQPRREVFEAVSPGKHPIYVHVEKIGLNVPMRHESINVGKGKSPVKVLVPDPNYLVARLLFGASSPTRTWNRAVDDLAYLCHLMEFNKSEISKRKTVGYLRKLCAGKSKLDQRLANFSARLDLVTQKELNQRVRATRPRANFDYSKALKKLNRVFGGKGKPDPRVVLSRHVYYLSKREKEQLAKRFSVRQREGQIWNAVHDRLGGLSRNEIERINGMTQKQKMKRLRRL